MYLDTTYIKCIKRDRFNETTRVMTARGRSTSYFSQCCTELLNPLELYFINCVLKKTFKLLHMIVDSRASGATEQKEGKYRRKKERKKERMIERRHENSLKVFCEKEKISNCEFCNNFRDNAWTYV